MDREKEDFYGVAVTDERPESDVVNDSSNEYVSSGLQRRTARRLRQYRARAAGAHFHRETRNRIWGR